MRTWLTYENGSLNPHVPRLGIFWDVARDVPGTVPVLWKAIEKCRFGWHHPLCIDWEPSFLLRDRYGNQRQLTPGVTYSDTGTRLDGPEGSGLSAAFLLSQHVPRPDLVFMICRNNRPMAEISLVAAGTWSLTLPDRMVMQIECPIRLYSQLTEPAGIPFALTGLRSLRVALRGGAPGPLSTPLHLVPYRAEPL